MNIFEVHKTNNASVVKPNLLRLSQFLTGSLLGSDVAHTESLFANAFHIHLGVSSRLVGRRHRNSSRLPHFHTNENQRRDDCCNAN